MSAQNGPYVNSIDPEIGTVLGIVCNVRDSLIRHQAVPDELDIDFEVADLQRAVDLLKPMVIPHAR